MGGPQPLPLPRRRRHRSPTKRRRWESPGDHATRQEHPSRVMALVWHTRALVGAASSGVYCRERESERGRMPPGVGRISPRRRRKTRVRLNPVLNPPRSAPRQVRRRKRLGACG
jgi:hypothetical protein